MASIIEQLPLDIERLAYMLLFAVLLTTLVAILFALTRKSLAAGTRWIRHRRSSLAPGESTFVGRWGRQGPELFVVGAGARKLHPPRRGKPDAGGREVGDVGAVFAALMLLEILGHRPSRELVWAFVEERLTHLPADGFVLSTSEVIGWVDAYHAAPSERGGRVAALAWAGAAFVGFRVRRIERSAAEERAPGTSKASTRRSRPGPGGPLLS